jgi:ferredoxin
MTEHRPPERRRVRLTVNPAVCDGFGFCAEILPEVISLDEWGFPVVGEAEIPETLSGAARKAVSFCPRRALGLVQA